MSIIKSKKGQMLIEVIFSLGVVVLVMVAMLSATTVSVRNTRHAQNMVKANQYTKEGIETARRNRDQSLDWETFKTNYSGNICSPPIGIFIRCINYGDTSPIDINKRRIYVTVSWTEATLNHTSQAETILTKWGQ